MVASPSLIGALAGNYRLVARLGAGGMGEVYKAVHTTIGAKVAIKVLTALEEPTAQQRFLLEAQAVNRIAHPNVVKILDVGQLADGRPYLVMELLEGESLHELRKARLLSISDACRAIVDALDALAAAHAAGIVHRDLKPANIFRTLDGRIVVLDFGIAKRLDPDASASLTGTGMAVGTPHYMAPEQLRGEEVGPAADIYAIGVALYELVCNRRPFDSDDEQEVMLGHLERRPPPPRAIEPGVPELVQDVILTSLQKEPAHRFRTAAAMRDALHAAIDPNTTRRVLAPPRGSLPSVQVRTQSAATKPASPAAHARLDPDTQPPTATDRPPPPRRRMFAWVAVGIAAAGIAVVLALVASSGSSTPVARPVAVVLDAAPLPDAAPTVTLDAAIVVEVVVDAAVRDASTKPTGRTGRTGRAPRDAGVPVAVTADAAAVDAAPPAEPALATGKGWAEVESNVDGAIIKIRGREIGRTPWTGQLPLGKHHVTVGAPGYRSATGMLDVVADWTDSLSLTLKPVEP